MTVERWTLNIDRATGYVLETSDDGEYVEWEEYEALRTKLARAKEAFEFIHGNIGQLDVANEAESMIKELSV